MVSRWVHVLARQEEPAHIPGDGRLPQLLAYVLSVHNERRRVVAQGMQLVDKGLQKLQGLHRVERPALPDEHLLNTANHALCGRRIMPTTPERRT
jgi:hypothetical protein